MELLAQYADGPPKRTSGRAAGTYALWLAGGPVRSTAGMFVSDDALLDVSFTAAQARLATSCWFTNGRACAGIGLSPGVANGETPDA